MDRLFVITGVNRGLGLSLLKETQGRGLEVEGVSRSPMSEQIPPGTHFTQLNCADMERVLEFWQRLYQEYGENKYIVLINNAGTYLSENFEHIDMELMTHIVSDTFYTAVNMTKGLLSHFPSAIIINIIAVTALKPGIGKTAYGAAKAAMSNFYSALRTELSGGKYRIMNIYPGSINTWSPKSEPECIVSEDLAQWIVSMALLNESFEIADCTILPFGV